MERTLRRLLGAVEKELLHKPDKKVLDRLSLLAGFQDWDAFQRAWDGGKTEEEPTVDGRRESQSMIDGQRESQPTIDGQRDSQSKKEEA